MDILEKDKRRKELGAEGENIACEYLRSKGCDIFARNWRSSHKEIDIIAISGRDIRIVEVKTRQEPLEGEAWEAVDHKKQANLTAAAKLFLQSGDCRGLPFVLDEVHFDVITVVWDLLGERFRLEYIPDAFFPVYT